MRVVVVQFTAGLDPAANRAALDERLAAIDAADLVVLPEAAMCGFGPADFDPAAVAEPTDGPFAQVLRRHAERLDAVVLGGMFERRDGLPFNTVLAVGPGGELAAYRKIHLFDAFSHRESDRFAAGPIEPVVIEVAGLRLGLLMCYDLRFPELARALVDRGAQALVVPAAWFAGPGKLDQWRTLLSARAIENVAFVIAAGQGPDLYCGHSLIVDAWGAIVAGLSDADGSVVCELDPASVDGAREVNPSLSNRRMRP